MKRNFSLLLVVAAMILSLCACQDTGEKNKITLYAPDGRELVVDKSEMVKYQALGWYEMPVQTVYAEDGRTKVIAKSELDEYKSNGWYESPVQKPDIVVNNNTTIIENEKSASDTSHEDSRILWGEFTKNISGGLNVRAEPSHDSKLVGTIYDDTPLYYYGNAGTGMGSDGKVHQWIKVETAGRKVVGYVRRDLVNGEEYAGDGTGVIYIKNVDGNLNVRMEPKHDSALMATITDATDLEWLGGQQFGLGSDGKTHEWHEVIVMDGSYIIGWVRLDLVKEKY